MAKHYLHRLTYSFGEGKEGHMTFAVRCPALAPDWAYSTGQKLAQALHKGARVTEILPLKPSRWNKKT